MKFIEESHEYTDGEIKYTPVTYFLKYFQPWVDWDNEAAKKAKKLGITKEELLKQWDEKRDNAARKGTAFHKMMEDEMNSKLGIEIEGVSYPINAVETIEGVKEDKDAKLLDNTIYTEKMIWSPKYKICGTADLVEVIDGKINIKDYKTNEKLDWEAWKHPVKGPAKLKYPVSSLDDCKGNVYQLQLNTYMYMLLMQNRHLKMGKMEILHIVFKEDGKFEIIPYKVKNLLKEVSLMLDLFRQKHS